MRPILALLLCFLLLPGCGGGGGDPRLQKSGTLAGQFVATPDPPQVGHDSGLGVVLTDKGAPVAGAQVNMATFFRGLNQTGPTATLIETSPGRYEAREVSLGMGGKWEAEVTVSRANQPDVKLTFPFNVAR